jgi:Fe-S oxidoreductase
VPGLDGLVAGGLDVIRTELGRFPRQASGFSLEHLTPERGHNLAKALVGTEGAVATVIEAEVDLVDAAPAPALVVLGYPDLATAADAAPALVAHAPLAVEGLDRGIVDAVRAARGAGAVPDLPSGAAWLMVEVGGASAVDAAANAQQLLLDAGTAAHRIIPAGADALALWRIRADGAGLAGRTPDGRPAWPGWEDAAVPPERLGAYLRDFRALLDSYGLDGLCYGHFGDGCVHVRIDLPLHEPDSPALLRRFLTDAARLVAVHGGSMSGEHGDGRARGELLPLMYSPEAIGLFEGFKHLLDPDDLLNPGVIVRPRPVDRDLRRPGAPALVARRGFGYEKDGGDFTTAVHRCVGLGKCRADATPAGGFMCPSFLATRDEKDSTRGRARVLQEMIRGELVSAGWRSPEVREALDLCLSCKACASECPAGVDMAAYKAETLHQAYAGRVRPRSHYALGWLPRWARVAGVLPGLVNAALARPMLARLALRAAGIDARRQVPRFADVPFRRRRAGTSTAGPVDPDRPEVVLWVDCFTDAFSPAIAEAARAVLTDAGYTVRLPERTACCGLTWISTGQFRGARRRLRRLLGALTPEGGETSPVEGGAPPAGGDASPAGRGAPPVVGLEPSCTAVLRSDLAELMPHDPRAARLARRVRTLAEVLGEARRRGWTPPSTEGVSAVVQPHCHHHAVLGFAADADLLAATGVQASTVAGCCGLAGNFGMEQGHYEVSVRVAENALLPALREAREGTILLADGFSCRVQADQLAGVRGIHLAEFLAGRLPRAE